MQNRVCSQKASSSSSASAFRQKVLTNFRQCLSFSVWAFSTFFSCKQAATSAAGLHSQYQITCKNSFPPAHDRQSPLVPCLFLLHKSCHRILPYKHLIQHLHTLFITGSHANTVNFGSFKRFRLDFEIASFSRSQYRDFHYEGKKLFRRFTLLMYHYLLWHLGTVAKIYFSKVSPAHTAPALRQNPISLMNLRLTGEVIP